MYLQAVYCCLLAGVGLLVLWGGPWGVRCVLGAMGSTRVGQRRVGDVCVWCGSPRGKEKGQCCVLNVPKIPLRVPSMPKCLK